MMMAPTLSGLKLTEIKESGLLIWFCKSQPAWTKAGVINLVRMSVSDNCFLSIKCIPSCAHSPSRAILRFIDNLL